MKLHACSVYDVKVEAYQAPFYARTLGEAERFWTDLRLDQNSPYFKHPEDYQLYRVGEFDELTGILSGVQEVVRITGSSVEVSDDGR